MDDGASDAPTCGLAEFAAQHGVALTRFAYLLCGNRATADDLVQDTYLNLYRRFGDDLTVAAPLAYARRALVNLHVSQRRRRASGEIASILNCREGTVRSLASRAVAELRRHPELVRARGTQS